MIDLFASTDTMSVTPYVEFEEAVRQATHAELASSGILLAESSSQKPGISCVCNQEQKKDSAVLIGGHIDQFS